MKKILLLLLFSAFVLCAGEKFSAIYTLPGELDTITGHVQGICASNDAIYLSHQKGIVKLSWNGKVLKHVPAPDHTGDICFYNGKLYAAIAYYGHRRGKGAIKEYSADLDELRTLELDFPTDGITVLNGSFYFGAGPNPSTLHRGNRLARTPLDLSGKITFIKIDHGFPTRFGTQAITTCGNFLIATFYGGKNTRNTAIFDADGKLIQTFDFNAGMGFAALPPRFKTSTPVFLRLRALYNMRKKESPRVCFDFYALRNGTLVKINK